jgi:hypothetical protein
MGVAVHLFQVFLDLNYQGHVRACCGGDAGQEVVEVWDIICLFVFYSIILTKMSRNVRGLLS